LPHVVLRAQLFVKIGARAPVSGSWTTRHGEGVPHFSKQLSTEGNVGKTRNSPKCTACHESVRKVT